jgi:NodT family efflux transporter outer membrane factor (OMF) lipoprotein
MKRIVLMLSSVLFGCAVGPDYKRPEVETPEAFKELPGWSAARPQDEAPKGPWWTVFNDAQLDALLQRVDVSNQTIRQAEARQRQAKALYDQARASLFPPISANASAQRSKAPSLSNQPSFATGAVNNFNLNVATSWEIDLWGKVRRGVEAGEASLAASAADVEAARLSSRASLAQAYFSLRVVDEGRRILEETVAAYQRSVDLTQNRYNAGIVARVDVVQAQVQLKSTQAQLIDLGVDRAQFEHAIAILLGEPPSKFSLERAKLDTTMPAIPVVVPSVLLQRRPDVAAAERNAAAANARIGVAQAAYFPAITLSGSAGYRNTDINNLIELPFRFWSLGAAITQPLFDAGLRKAQTAQAVAIYDEDVATYRQTVLIGFQEVEDNLAALRILEEEAKLQDEVVVAAQRSLDLTVNQYQQGVANYLAVITAQAILLNNQRTAVTILGRRLTASINLVKAMGGGWSTADLPPPP